MASATTGDPARDALTPEEIEADVAAVGFVLHTQQTLSAPVVATAYRALTRLATAARRGVEVEAAAIALHETGAPRLCDYEEVMDRATAAERRAAEMEAALRSAAEEISSYRHDTFVDEPADAVFERLVKEAGGR